MNAQTAQLNLLFAWLWMLLGFVSGMILGLFFHRETWLGGYGSFKRRMYRLGHISFFGLGAVNLLFWLTMQKISGSEPLADAASCAFIVGGVTMPLCCGLMAHFPKARLIFAVPVLSLIVGGVLTLALVSHTGVAPATSHEPRYGARVCDPQQFRQSERLRNKSGRLENRALLRLAEPRSGLGGQSANSSGESLPGGTPQNFEMHQPSVHLNIP